MLHLAAVKPGSNYLTQYPRTEIKKPACAHKESDGLSGLGSIGNLLVRSCYAMPRKRHTLFAALAVSLATDPAARVLTETFGGGPTLTR
jgi:hypothetical protein